MRAASERARRREADHAALRYRERTAWIAGYPERRGGALVVVTVPERGEVTTRALAPDAISAALRAFRVLAREGDAALARVVACPERVEPLLARLGAVARGAEAAEPPVDLFRPRSRELHARVRRVAGPGIADAVAWTFAAEGLEHEALGWLDAAAPRLAGLAESLGALERAPDVVLVTTQLARLAVSGAERGADDVLALLASPGHLHVGCAPTPGARSTPGLALLALLDDALRMDAPARRRALQLACATYPRAWIAAWRKHDDDAARAKRREANDELARTFGKSPAPAEKTKPEAPSAFGADAWRRVIAREATHRDAGARALDRFVTTARAHETTDDEATRLFVAFARTLRGEPPRRFVELLHALAEGLERGLPPARLLAGWRSVRSAPVSENEPRSWRESDVDDLPRALPLARVFTALGALPSLDAARPDRVLDAFFALAARGVPLAQAGALAEAVPRALERAQQTWVEDTLVVLAAGLAEHETKRFEALLAPLVESRARRWFPADGLLAFVERHGVREAIAREVETGRAARVARWADVLALLGRDADALVPASPPSLSSRRAAWIERLPEPLRPALRELAAATRDAEARATRVLGRIVQLPADLDAEIEALRAKEPDPRRLRRLANLEARRAAGDALPAAVVRRATKALAEEATRARLEEVERTLDDAAYARAAAKLGPAARRLLEGDVVVPASAVVQRELRVMLAALARLPSRERTLASALLARRVGPPHFHLRDAPRNRAWITAARERGMRLDAWFDPGAREVEVPGGRRIGLALEDDPLEIFLMGEHFETCLSLGGGNFFSTVVNAVDANKRVLFARENGKVVGRCLLAITEEGSLLTFHPYAHEARLGLTERFADFARDLARRIGIRTAPRGRVLPLEAARWYDDGPRDLTGAEPRLAPASDLVRELESIAPEALAPRLEAVFEEGLDARVLTLVLGLDVVKRRPELAVALAVRAFRTPFVAFETRLEVAQACHAAGAEALARELLGVHGIEEWLLVPCPCGECEARPNLLRALDLLVRLAPFRALRLLRASRPRKVRGWRDEDEVRALAAARAYRAMGRPAHARSVLEQAFAGAKARGGATKELRDALAATAR